MRPLGLYLDRLRAAGFPVLNVLNRSIQAEEFLAAYHEGVLGWAGGSRRVEQCRTGRRRLEDVGEGASWTCMNRSGLDPMTAKRAHAMLSGWRAPSFGYP